MTPCIRWMVRNDLFRVLAIEQASFPNPWTEEEFIRCLRQRNVIGMVAETADNNLLGFMIYELHKNRIVMLNFAVHPKHRRHGYGFEMVRKLYGKLHEQRRRALQMHVGETNLDGLLFLKACGFLAIQYERDWFGEWHEPAILMQLRYHPEVEMLTRKTEFQGGIRSR